MLFSQCWLNTQLQVKFAGKSHVTLLYGIKCSKLCGSVNVVLCINLCVWSCVCPLSMPILHLYLPPPQPLLPLLLLPSLSPSSPPLPRPTCGSRPPDPSAARTAPGCLCPPPLHPPAPPSPPYLRFSSSRSLSCPYSSRLSMPSSPPPSPSLPAVLVLQIPQLPVQLPVVYAPLTSPLPLPPPLPTCGSRPPDPSAARTAPGCLCPPHLPPPPPPSPSYLRFSSSRSLSCPYSSRLSYRCASCSRRSESNVDTPDVDSATS